MVMDIENYPANYDWIPVEKQNAILAWVESSFDMCDYFNRKSVGSGRNCTMYGNKAAQMSAAHLHALSLLEDGLGIYVAHDWHCKSGWFLATRADAELEEEYLFEMADEED